MKYVVVMGLLCALASAACASDATVRGVSSPAEVVRAYDVIGAAYRSNDFTLFKPLVLPQFSFIEVGGARASLADLETGAQQARRSGGTVTGATVTLQSFHIAGDRADAMVTVTTRGRIGGTKIPCSYVQIDRDRDTWQRTNGTWKLLVSAIQTETTTVTHDAVNPSPNDAKPRG